MSDEINKKLLKMFAEGFLAGAIETSCSFDYENLLKAHKDILKDIERDKIVSKKNLIDALEKLNVYVFG